MDNIRRHVESVTIICITALSTILAFIVMVIQTRLDVIMLLLVIIFFLSIILYRRLKKLKYMVEECRRYIGESSRDPLTGVFNRREAKRQIEEAVRIADRYDQRFGLVFVDLNRFKQVNDRCGHQVGDQVLNETAMRFKRSFRESDTIFRLGGDEFLILVRMAESRSCCTSVISKLRASLVAPIDADKHMVTIGASFGSAIYPLDGLDAVSIIESADQRMYREKKISG